MSLPINNKVAESGIMSVDLATFLPNNEIVVFDIKPHLFMELILKEKEFRAALNAIDWPIYKDKIVGVFCSTDAIIPMWANMLIVSNLQPHAHSVYFGDINKVREQLILENINSTYANGPVAWLNSNGEGVNANANDIIEWSGEAWEIVFNSNQATGVTYITNAYTGIQYKWDLTSWSKSFDGIYNNGAWRLIL